jgi:hypothetical protein
MSETVDGCRSMWMRVEEPTTLTTPMAGGMEHSGRRRLQRRWRRGGAGHARWLEDRGRQLDRMEEDQRVGGRVGWSGGGNRSGCVAAE